MESAMVSIIMLACVFSFIGGLIALVKALIKKKNKKALIWLGIVISSTFIYQTIGTAYWAKHPQDQGEKQQAREETKEKQDVKQKHKDITKAECEQIKYHMTYEQVRNIVTYDGEITSSEQIGNDLVQHAVWTNSDGSILEVVMKNKIVTNWWGVCERK